MADIDYYNDSTQHGNYQYVSVNQIINDMLATVDSDDYISKVPRYTLLYHAYRGVRELYYDVVREVRAVQITIGDSLTMVLPRDYVNYVRISLVDGNGNLMPMACNSETSLAEQYLQDSNDQLLFDNEGCILTADGNSPMPQNQVVDDSVFINNFYQYAVYQGQLSSFNPNANLANYYPNGSYRIDKERGVIQFGSNVTSREVVLEYISDGLFTSACEQTGESDIKIHKFAEQCLINYIYWANIKMKRNVPANEKERAKKDYYNQRRLTKRRISGVKLNDLLQAFKQDTTWIKDPNTSNNYFF